MVEVLNKEINKLENEYGEKFGEIYVFQSNLKFTCIKCTQTVFDKISLLESHIYSKHIDIKNMFAIKDSVNETIHEIAELAQLPQIVLQDKNNSGINFKKMTNADNEGYFQVNTLSDSDSNEQVNFGLDKTQILKECTKSDIITTEILNNEDIKQKCSIGKIEIVQADTKIKRYPCSYCDKTYATKKRQKDHIYSHLGLNQLFKCEECGACLRSSSTLKSHMRIHTGERPFECTLCSKTFRANPGLLNHMTVHTGEKKFSCSFCEKRFQTKAHAQIHERIHTGEKPFQCDECGIKFASSSYLAEHNKRHKNLRPFNCDTCEKSFFSNQQMLLHKVVHTKEKKFICKICSACFGRKRSLKQHEKTHANSKDYKCKLCDESFPRYSAIYYHMKSKHKHAPFSYNYIPTGPRGRK